MKKLLFLFFLIAPICCVYASSLRSDTLTFQSNQLLNLYPQNAVLQKTLSEMYKPACFDGCSEGFETDWKIIDKRLYLCNVYGCCSNNITADLGKLFKGKVKNGRVAATWVTDTLWIPTGKNIHNDSNFRTFFDQETYVSIKNGELDYIKVFNYPNAHESALAKDLNLFSTSIFKNINWQKVPPVTGKPLRVIIQFSSGATSKPESIRILRGSNNAEVDKEAVRVIGLLNWGVYYFRGKVYHEHVTVPLTFSEEMREMYAK